MADLLKLVDFPWSEQPKRNLWRRPDRRNDGALSEDPPHVASRAAHCHRRQNSEGRLAGAPSSKWASAPVLRDRRGFREARDLEKPDRRILLTSRRTRSGCPRRISFYVGDAWAADIEGALGVGAKAIWITEDKGTTRLPAGVVACRTASDVRSALRAWGVPA